MEGCSQGALPGAHPENSPPRACILILRGADTVGMGEFSGKTGVLAPNNVQKLLEIDAFRKALSRALEKHLGLAPL